MFPTSDLNLVRSLTNICDTYLKPYYDEEHLKTMSQVDMRIQIEVRFIIILDTTLIFKINIISMIVYKLLFFTVYMFLFLYLVNGSSIRYKQPN